MAEQKSLPTLSYLLLDPKRPYIHRDISWIQFNDRVLAEARSRSNPLLKRVKFLSISSSNLDEFFMIRFASLLRSISSSKIEENKLNLIRIESTVLEHVRQFGKKQGQTLDLLRKECAEHGVFLHVKCPKDSPAFFLGREIFQEHILPQIQTKNGFKYSSIQELENLQLLAYINANLYFVISRSLPSVFCKTNGTEVHVFFLDDLIISHLDHMLPFKEKPGIIRITRDADFTTDFSDIDTESVPDLMKKQLSNRDKGRLVRLQFYGNFPKEFIEEAADQLKLDLRQCFATTNTLCLHGLLGCMNNLPLEISEKPGFNNLPLQSSTPPAFLEESKNKIFDALRKMDFILHHPYDSFDAFILWLEKACNDPNVQMIEQTIYRTDSKIVDLLKAAAPHKKVKVVLELRARFDESHNLKIAEELSKAGAEIHFGFGALKLHAKITLVTRKEGDKIVRYTHLSTGNYNTKTARQYTDISILTGSQEVGEDARIFFDAVYKNEVPSQFKLLVTAPIKLHQKIRSLIKAETEAAKAGQKARIVAKVNALVDEKIIEDLYNASQAGVSIDLIVRGACSLVPGIKGLSENIRVISIVDRFLEHSRIYYFEHSQVIYLSSADWMPRNFFSRLEIAFPVLDKKIYQFIVEVILPGYLKDNTRARKLNARGLWEKVSKTGQQPALRAQKYFEDLAVAKYKDTPLFDHPFFEKLKDD